MFVRDEYNELEKRLYGKNLFIQIITGPRQVGKTTLIRQILKNLKYDSIYVNADENYSNEAKWIDEMWQNARLRSKGKPYLLVIDEVQKINNWSKVVKANWDKDKLEDNPIYVILSGSSQMLLQKGLSESLAGRYELTYLVHWTYSEMQQAFDFSLDDYILYGGYPGAMTIFDDKTRWKNYIKNSIIESSISQDVIQMSTIYKPALMKALFNFAVHFSGQILSFNKIIGQLDDAGNTTTIANYLALLNNAGLIAGLEKFTKMFVKTKSSSPKFQVYNNSFLTALNSNDADSIRTDSKTWGRWVESAVGTYLINQSVKKDFDVFYWRENNAEVDFIIRQGEKIAALEVKSSVYTKKHSGLELFKRKYKDAKSYIIGDAGISLEEFFIMDINDFFRI